MARAKKYSTKYFGIGGGKEIPVVVNYKEEANGNYTYIFNLSEFKTLVSNFDTKAVALADKLEGRSFIVAAYKHTNSVYVEMENKTTTTVIIGDIYNAIRSDFADPLKNANDPKGTSGVASMAGSSGSSSITAPSPIKDAVAASSYDTIYEEQLDTVKKEIEQLISMRSFVSPIDFEKKIQFNQKIDEAQKRLNDLNFKIVESRLTKDDIFEDLFEQSFTPIKNDYQDVYASNLVGEQPVSADFFTPNGQPSKLSDALNQLIRTPQFNEWFGNWQLSYAYRDNVDDSVPCSAVTTKDYEPLLVWHGTGTQFSYFRFDNFPAAYFAVTKAYSEWFADLHGGGEGYTIPFFLNIRNPLDLSKFKITKIKPKEFFDYMFLKTGMDMEQLGVNPIFMDSTLPPMETWIYLRNNPTMLQKIADSHVFDGIHFYESNPSVPEGQAAHSTEAFIIFNPNQCKIADPERGLFMLGSLKSFLLKYGGKI